MWRGRLLAHRALQRREAAAFRKETYGLFAELSLMHQLFEASLIFIRVNCPGFISNGVNHAVFCGPTNLMMSRCLPACELSSCAKY